MLARLLFSLSLFLLSACAPFIPAQPPSVRQDEVHAHGATTLEFSPGGDYLVSGGNFGEIIVWRMPKLQRMNEFVLHRGNQVRGLVWINEHVLISAGEDGALVSVDIRNGVQQKVDTDGEFTALAYSPQLRLLFTGNAAGELVARELADNLPVRAQRSLGARINAIAVDVHGRIALAVADQRVLLGDGQLERLRPLSSPQREVLSLDFSPDGNTLAGGTWFKLVQWDLESGTMRTGDTEHAGEVISLAYAPDGAHIATIGRETDAQVRWIDSAKGTVERRMAPHDLCGYAVRVSPDGRFVATASEDESVRLYDLAIPYEPVISRQ